MCVGVLDVCAEACRKHAQKHCAGACVRTRTRVRVCAAHARARARCSGAHGGWVRWVRGAGGGVDKAGISLPFTKQVTPPHLGLEGGR